MSEAVVRNDSAGMPIAKNGNASPVRAVRETERRKELNKNYRSVRIISPVVGPQTDSARISAAVDAVMEKKVK